MKKITIASITMAATLALVSFARAEDKAPSGDNSARSAEGATGATGVATGKEAAADAQAPDTKAKAVAESHKTKKTTKAKKSIKTKKAGAMGEKMEKTENTSSTTTEGTTH